MVQYEASRNTIRAALRELQDMGLITRRRNRGTLVMAKPATGAFTQSLATLDDLVTLARRAKREIVDSAEVVLDTVQARELGCAAGSRWLHIGLRRQEAAASEPLAWTDAYIDPRYKELPRLAKRQPDQLFCDLIEARYGRRIASIDQRISGCLLAAPMAQRLHVAEATAGLKIIRQYRDSAGALVLATVSTYPAHRYSLTTTLVRSRRPDVPDHPA